MSHVSLVTLAISLLLRGERLLAVVQPLDNSRISLDDARRFARSIEIRIELQFSLRWSRVGNDAIRVDRTAVGEENDIRLIRVLGLIAIAHCDSRRRWSLVLSTWTYDILLVVLIVESQLIEKVLQLMHGVRLVNFLISASRCGTRASRARSIALKTLVQRLLVAIASIFHTQLGRLLCSIPITIADITTRPQYRPSIFTISTTVRLIIVGRMNLQWIRLTRRGRWRGVRWIRVAEVLKSQTLLSLECAEQLERWTQRTQLEFLWVGREQVFRGVGRWRSNDRRGRLLVVVGVAKRITALLIAILKGLGHLDEVKERLSLAHFRPTLDAIVSKLLLISVIWVARVLRRAAGIASIVLLMLTLHDFLHLLAARLTAMGEMTWTSARIAITETRAARTIRAIAARARRERFTVRRMTWDLRMQVGQRLVTVDGWGGCGGVRWIVGRILVFCGATRRFEMLVHCLWVRSFVVESQLFLFDFLLLWRRNDGRILLGWWDGSFKEEFIASDRLITACVEHIEIIAGMRRQRLWWEKSTWKEDVDVALRLGMYFELFLIILWWTMRWLSEIAVVVFLWWRRDENVIARCHQILFGVEETTKLRLEEIGARRGWTTICRRPWMTLHGRGLVVVAVVGRGRRSWRRQSDCEWHKKRKQNRGELLDELKSERTQQNTQNMSRVKRQMNKQKKEHNREKKIIQFSGCCTNVRNCFVTWFTCEFISFIHFHSTFALSCRALRRWRENRFAFFSFFFALLAPKGGRLSASSRKRRKKSMNEQQVNGMAMISQERWKLL